MHPDVKTITGTITGRFGGLYGVSIGGGFPFINVPSVHPGSQYFEGQGIILAFFNPDAPVIISKGYESLRMGVPKPQIMISGWPQFRQNLFKNAKAEYGLDLAGTELFRKINEEMMENPYDYESACEPVVTDTVDGKELVFANMQGNLHNKFLCWDGETGEEIWTYTPTGEEILPKLEDYIQSWTVENESYDYWQYWEPQDCEVERYCSMENYQGGLTVEFEVYSGSGHLIEFEAYEEWNGYYGARVKFYVGPQSHVGFVCKYIDTDGNHREADPVSYPQERDYLILYNIGQYDPGSVEVEFETIYGSAEAGELQEWNPQTGEILFQYSWEPYSNFHFKFKSKLSGTTYQEGGSHIRRWTNPVWHNDKAYAISVLERTYNWNIKDASLQTFEFNSLTGELTTSHFTFVEAIGEDYLYDQINLRTFNPLLKNSKIYFTVLRKIYGSTNAGFDMYGDEATYLCRYDIEKGEFMTKRVDGVGFWSDYTTGGEPPDNSRLCIFGTDNLVILCGGGQKGYRKDGDYETGYALCAFDENLEQKWTFGEGEDFWNPSCVRNPTTGGEFILCYKRIDIWAGEDAKQSVLCYSLKTGQPVLKWEKQFTGGYWIQMPWGEMYWTNQPSNWRIFDYSSYWEGQNLVMVCIDAHNIVSFCADDAGNPKLNWEKVYQPEYSGYDTSGEWPVYKNRDMILGLGGIAIDLEKRIYVSSFNGVKRYSPDGTLEFDFNDDMVFETGHRNADFGGYIALSNRYGYFIYYNGLVALK